MNFSVRRGASCPIAICPRLQRAVCVFRRKWHAGENGLNLHKRCFQFVFASRDLAAQCFAGRIDAIKALHDNRGSPVEGVAHLYVLQIMKQ